MKVLIDEGLSTLQQLGGIGYHSVNLWQHLKRYVECDITDYHFLKIFPRFLKRAMYLGLVNLQPMVGRYEIIHFQNYYVPRYFNKAKGVATVHDLGGLKTPEVYPEWYNAYFRRILRNTILRSDAIVLPSHSVKEDLFSFFPNIDESKVFVCYNGIRSIFFQTEWTEKNLVPMNLRPYSYFLYIGNLEKRKNLTSLLSGFIAARERFLLSHDTKLILVGKLGIGYNEFQHLISERNNIIHLGRLSQEQIVVLYKFCKAFVFPSLYEGFGIPILEAMSQGVPILISDISPSLELNRRHNNQCFVFRLDREETLIEMLSHLDKNFETIVPRLNYGDLSIYSYDRVAQEHLKVYNQILSKT